MTALRLALSELRRLTAGRMPRLAVLAIVLIPTMYASLYLWANHDPYGKLATVQAALTGIANGRAIDYVPRFHFVEDVAMCIYHEDVAYDDITRIDSDGPRHRLYLHEQGWDYQRIC